MTIEYWAPTRPTIGTLVRWSLNPECRFCNDMCSNSIKDGQIVPSRIVGDGLQYQVQAEPLHHEIAHTAGHDIYVALIHRVRLPGTEFTLAGLWVAACELEPVGMNRAVPMDSGHGEV